MSILSIEQSALMQVIKAYILLKPHHTFRAIFTNQNLVKIGPELVPEGCHTVHLLVQQSLV